MVSCRYWLSLTVKSVVRVFNIRRFSASVLSGISVPQDPNFTCPSGNCTWGAYETLGICSSCEDFSNKAQKNCTLGNLNDIYCDYDLTSEGIALSMVMITSTSDDNAGGTILNSTATLLGLGTRTLTRIAILRVDLDEYEQMRKHPNNYTDVAKSIHVRKLTWCLKKFESAKVNNGVFEESLQENPFILQDRGSHETSMKNCTENFGYSLTYKLFGGQGLNMQDQRMDELFWLCPDIMKISEEEDMYIVNYNDERYILLVLLDRRSLCLIHASFTNPRV